jgi:hypothetical protein
MASKANLVMDQGSNFSATITLTDGDGNLIDMSGFTGSSQMRKSYSSVNSTSIGVTINTTAATITLTLDSPNTALITPGRYVYDVDIMSSLNVTSRILEGIVTVTPAVTKSENNPTYYSLLVANVQGSFYTGDIVYQSNGSANISGVVYKSELLLTEIANTMVIKISSSNGAFIPSANSAVRIYSANSVSNTIANGSILTVTRLVAP